MKQSRKLETQKIRYLLNYKLVLFLACITIALSPLRAQDAKVPRTSTFPGIENSAFHYVQPEKVGLSTEKLNRLGEEITKWVANGELVGAELLIIKHDNVVFHEAYGWSDRENKIPVKRNSIWSIKSMTKPVTATAILMLAEEGKVSLDDPVQKYIPEFKGDHRATIRHLLSHTSGDEDSDGGIGVYNFDSLREWVMDWAVQEATGNVGEFSYSNLNYAALGYIVEVVTSEPVEAFILKRIVLPLGLQETYISFSPCVSWASRLSNRYRWNNEIKDYEKFWSTKEKQPWLFFPAAFGLFSTAMDYAKFLSLWMNRGEYNGKVLLKEKTVIEALQPHGYLNDEPVSGYGWFVEPGEQAGDMPYVFRHSGADGTIAVAWPTNNAIVLWLTHSQGVDHIAAIQNRINMMRIFDAPGPFMVWADNPVEMGIKNVELSTVEKADLTGTYRGSFQWAEGNENLTLNVWEKDDIIHFRMGKDGMLVDQQYHLVPIGNNRYLQGRYLDGKLDAVDPYVIIRFIQEDNKIIACEIIQGGEIAITAKKEQ